MYEAFYGLTGKPFQLNPDPEFFFASRGHARAYAYLQYGLYQSEGFIVVTGEVGAGKTTLVRSLLKRLDTTKVVAAQIVTTQLDAEELLKAVAATFGVPSRRYRQGAAPRQPRGVLRFAGAGSASARCWSSTRRRTSPPRAVEELRMLSNFQLDNRALLQSFLVGQPELRQVLHSGQMQQLRQRVIASYHLGPMERPETGAYIEHRLKHVGWKGDPAFDADAFDAIHAASAGIPRRINLVCDRVLLAGYLGEKHRARRGRRTRGGERDPARARPGDHHEPPGAAPRPASGGPPRICPCRSVSSAPAEPDLAKLEERIMRLERLLHSTVSLAAHTRSSASSRAAARGGVERHFDGRESRTRPGRCFASSARGRTS